jgi:16S rRNA (cytosine967-C5)-methyltransferase
MTPSARLQAAIELLDAIIIATRDKGASADRIASAFFAARRYAGSKDRRAIRELTWSAIRRLGERPDHARAAFVAMADDDAALAAMFDGAGYGAAAITADETRAKGGPLPHWLLPHFSALLDASEQSALLERAPLDVRVNALRTSRDAVLADLPDAQILAQTPYGLRLPTGFALDGHELLQSGKVDIQDLGSQLIAQACKAEPGMTVLDLCAGAGGKTLALAADMQGQGRLIAADTNRDRLSQLPHRSTRAGADYIQTILLNPGKETAILSDFAGVCDVVLVDAPCSGSGTWRRNPETRWRLDERELGRLVSEQARLLDIATELVRPGGHLVYAVCSLLAVEGKRQIESFLGRQAGWQAVEMTISAGRPDGSGRLLTPAHDGCDGFYLARLQRL